MYILFGGVDKRMILPTGEGDEGKMIKPQGFQREGNPSQALVSVHNESTGAETSLHAPTLLSSYPFNC